MIYVNEHGDMLFNPAPGYLPFEEPELVPVAVAEREERIAELESRLSQVNLPERTADCSSRTAFFPPSRVAIRDGVARGKRPAGMRREK